MMRMPLPRLDEDLLYLFTVANHPCLMNDFCWVQKSLYLTADLYSSCTGTPASSGNNVVRLPLKSRYQQEITIDRISW